MIRNECGTRDKVIFLLRFKADHGALTFKLNNVIGVNYAVIQAAVHFEDEHIFRNHNDHPILL
jgi:hypothetical protein